MTTFSFNLVDQGWIPCLMSGNGQGEGGGSKLLGLRDVLVHAHEIREIFDPSPPVTVALHRLLLAILHRNFGPKDSAAWKALWKSGRWDERTIGAYFDKWQHRFDLFDECRPFYQIGGIPFCQCDTSVATLAHEMASGNNPTLFDHTAETALPVVSPAAAARLVVAVQAFAVGGLVSYGKGEQSHKSAKAAPLAKGTVVLMKGENLFQTLMLNLHCYSEGDGEPFDFDPAGEKPAWERDEDTRPEDRRPTGYLDLLTWQSRRLRLKPETSETGQTVVRKATLMKGNQFPDGYSRHGRETMMAFVKVEKPKAGAPPWRAVSFSERRALWRDSLCLFQSVGDRRLRPKTADWISDLSAEGILSRSRVVPLEVCGLSTDKAKVLFWRHERLQLPLVYLDGNELVDALSKALEMAEGVGRAVNSSVRGMAERLATSLEAGKFVDHLAAGRLYWSRLEVPFKNFLVRLPEDRSVDEDGDTAYGAYELPKWAGMLRRCAREAFGQACEAAGTSARALHAVALAEKVFNGRLKEVLRPYEAREKEVVNA